MLYDCVQYEPPAYPCVTIPETVTDPCMSTRIHWFWLLDWTHQPPVQIEGLDIYALLYIGLVRSSFAKYAYWGFEIRRNQYWNFKIQNWWGIFSSLLPALYIDLAYIHSWAKGKPHHLFCIQIYVWMGMENENCCLVLFLNISLQHHHNDIRHIK